jgi:hypothetical protein
VAVNKYVVAGGVVAVSVAAVGVGVGYCHRDFSEAAAAGDFDRAERAMLETCGSAGKGMKEGAPSRMMIES